MSKDTKKIPTSKLLYQQHGQHSRDSVSSDDSFRYRSPPLRRSPTDPSSSQLSSSQTSPPSPQPCQEHRRAAQPLRRSQVRADDDSPWTSALTNFNPPGLDEPTQSDGQVSTDSQKPVRRPPVNEETEKSPSVQPPKEQAELERQKANPMVRKAAKRIVDAVVKEAMGCARVIAVQAHVPKRRGTEPSDLLKWEKERQREGVMHLDLPNVTVGPAAGGKDIVDRPVDFEGDSLVPFGKRPRLLSRLWHRSGTPVGSRTGSMLTQSMDIREDDRSRTSRSSKSRSASAWRSVSFLQYILEIPRHPDVLEWSFSKIVVIDIIRNRKDDLVCSARHTFSGEWAIIKIMWRKRFKLFSRGRAVARERKTWETVSACRFIVGLKAFFKTSRCYCFVAEYYEGCTLQSLLSEGALRDDVIVNIAAQVTFAIKYIHDRDMMYRNLSPYNILVDMQGTARLFDFSFCSLGKTSSSRVGSIPYMAPEVLRMEVYDKASDYWSLGILIYVMYVRHTPMSIYSAKTDLDHWVDRDYMYQYAEVVPIILPTHLHQAAKSFITGLLVERSRLRIGCRSTGFFELMKHPFFKGIDWEAFARKKTITTRNAPKGQASNRYF